MSTDEFPERRHGDDAPADPRDTAGLVGVYLSPKKAAQIDEIGDVFGTKDRGQIIADAIYTLHYIAQARKEGWEAQVISPDGRFIKRVPTPADRPGRTDHDEPASDSP